MKKQTKKWRMGNGKKIKICDMTDRHLSNTIAYIERTIELSIGTAPYLGDGNWLILESDPDLLEFLLLMEQEQERRKELGRAQ